MANLDFSIRNVKIFPEMIPITSAIGSLVIGNNDMIRIWQNPDKSKVVKGLDFAMDSVDNVVLDTRVDNQAMDQLLSNSLPGISRPYYIAEPHEFYWARDQVVHKVLNNTGGTVSNYRMRSTILVDDLTTVDKVMMGYPLEQRDNDAINVLKNNLGIDLYQKVTLGVGIPSQFSQFLAEHEVIPRKPFPYMLMEALPHGTNLSSTAVDLISRDVYNKGEEAWVVENLWFPPAAASDIGNVTIKITRDDDIDYLTLDPACFPSDSNNTTSITNMPLHIHAFDHLEISIVQSGGTHNSYQASATMSRRNIGLAFKAKILEFGGKLPKNVDITKAEQDIIDNLHLMELIRSGLYPVG